MGLEAGNPARCCGRAALCARQVRAIAATMLAVASVVALTQVLGVATATAAGSLPSTAVLVPSTGAGGYDTELYSPDGGTEGRAGGAWPGLMRPDRLREASSNRRSMAAAVDSSHVRKRHRGVSRMAA